MDNMSIEKFERIARQVHLFSDEEVKLDSVDHPFDTRNVHPALPDQIKKLFDDGYYSQATFEALKYLDKEVARLSNTNMNGEKLMLGVFSEDNPKIKLTILSNPSEKDEQRGYKFLFAGSIVAIRNPRGHEYSIRDNIDDCLDHLALVSFLLRRIEKSGYKLMT
jgi:uncharacterized protein (TIGR02391 family)